jgi:hypothetical protein
LSRHRIVPISSSSFSAKLLSAPFRCPTVHFTLYCIVRKVSSSEHIVSRLMFLFHSLSSSSLHSLILLPLHLLSSLLLPILLSLLLQSLLISLLFPFLLHLHHHFASSLSSSFPSDSSRPISFWTPLALPPVRESTPCLLKCRELLVQCSTYFPSINSESSLCYIVLYHTSRLPIVSTLTKHAVSLPPSLSPPLPASPSLQRCTGWLELL